MIVINRISMKAGIAGHLSAHTWRRRIAENLAAHTWRRHHPEAAARQVLGEE
jgi:hypothetical protein